MNGILIALIVATCVGIAWLISDSSAKSAVFAERCKTRGGTMMVLGGENGKTFCLKSIEFIDVSK